MVAGGVPGRLRRVPAMLLRLELAAGLMASLAGLRLLLSARSAGQAALAGTCAENAVRRAAVAMLFAVHTVRFGLYPRPGQGRRTPPAVSAVPGPPGEGRDGH
jgi:hypothetical protein